MSLRRVFGLALAVICVLVFLHSTDALTFSAFNIKWLTPSKYENEMVQRVIPKILQRYDIILVQELRGDGNAVMSRIVADLYNSTNKTYGYVLSSKIGRTSYKEQYAFLYVEDGTFSVRQALEYPDADDVFEREPYIISVNGPRLSVEDFAIVGLHAKLDQVPEELDKLVDVYDFVVANLSTQNVLFAGDFNADCRYLTGSEFDELQLTTDSRFSWLVDSSADTTVSTNTNCAYDRFVVAGDLKGAVVNGTVEVFNYQQAFSLSDEDAKIVSDHYPISLKLS